MNQFKLYLKIYGIYIALYRDAQSALQRFVGEFAGLLIKAQIAATQFTILLERILGYTVPPEQKYVINHYTGDNFQKRSFTLLGYR